MPDPRFFPSAGPVSLARVAEAAGVPVPEGAEGSRRLNGVAPLDQAGPDEVSFFDRGVYAGVLAESRAGLCLLRPGDADRAPPGTIPLPTPEPCRAFARVAALFHPPAPPRPGTAATASVAPDAVLGKGVEIGPGACVRAGAELGDRVCLGANAVVGPGVVLGADCEIGAGVSLSFCRLGARVRVLDGARLGGRGFGFDTTQIPYIDIPQLGRVLVADDVEIGANTTLDRGAGGDTVIGVGSRLDNLVQIGHNVRLGRGCVLVAQSGVAGSTVLEDEVFVGAQAGIAGHLHIGQGARIAAAAGVMRDVPAGQRVAGTPAMPARTFFRLVAAWQNLAKTKGKADE